MKIEKQKSRFETVTIVLESQLEVDALSALFDYGPVVDGLDALGNIGLGRRISEGLRLNAGSNDGYFEIVKSVIKDKIKKLDAARANKKK